MERRSLIGAGLGAPAALAATGLAAPAIAQTMPELRWRMTSSFTRPLDITYGAGEFLAEKVAELTDGKFRITQYAAGELVPAFQAMDAVSGNSVEMASSAGLFFTGKDTALAFATTVPFMLNVRQQHAWLYQGGGAALLNEVFAKFNVHALQLGNTGNQMGGWFRREIRGVADLDGLKMRVAGLAGNVMAKCGVVPQQIAPGDIYPSLERGTIDAVEYIGPYDDAKLGFNKVARYYYYPGWGEGGAMFQVFVNRDRWRELPRAYRAALETASLAGSTWMLSQYDWKNVDALYRLAADGTQLRQFPNDVIDALYRAAQEVFAEQSAANPMFKQLLESQVAFRDRSYAYHQVADFAFDSMMLRLRRGR
ncbi:TRAP transporter substrate-binding protein DctP [Roseomonas sp. NAR14]|uniref:TRAP transporter substrate-binding protein DctP n=1 Tax=Roseomonas acroporae TaxID=2937791 RepID=A0A9X2BV71_9PROT|nr:TRAP transporter substrate-binding protein DctP [Roseomonas acroporae]MCK8786357.1 TRAP transporter substrate-binding protein DctP [Roseomonas acroporae]